jgi:hypothetical protein
MLNHDHAAALHTTPTGLFLRTLGKIVIEIESAIKPRRKGNAIKYDGAKTLPCCNPAPSGVQPKSDE